MEIFKFKNRITDIWDYPKLSIYNNQIGTDNNFFIFLDSNSESEQGIRLYVHVPFCNSFCSFCQFYKEAYNKEEQYLDKYFKCVINELKMYADTKYIKNQKVTSIFFGGGDPSIIKYRYFKMMMDTIYEYYNVIEKPSISIEGNVKNLLDEERLYMYKEYGVSRVSFGVQTFNEALRKKLLIKPSLEEIDQVVQLIIKIDIESFAFDLMYNLPNQTCEDVINDIKKATSYNSSYIDFYSLNLYPNTKFYSDIYEKNKFNIKPDKSRELEQNKLIKKKMTEEGYHQVLSCTYSKEFNKPHPGLYHYLVGGNMLGIGPSARSYLDGKAFRNICSVEKYIEMLSNGSRPIETGTLINDIERRRRLAILAVTLLEINKELVTGLPDVQDKLNQLNKLGYIQESDSSYIVTPEGNPWIGNIQKVLFSDEIGSKEVTNFLKAVKDGRSAYNQDYMSIKGCN